MQRNLIFVRWNEKAPLPEKRCPHREMRVYTIYVRVRAKYLPLN